MKQFSPSTGLQVRQGAAVLLMVVLLAAGWLLMHPAPASGAPPQAGGQTDPTPAPQTAQPGSTRSVSPIVGIVVLLAPLVFLVWKSRGKKQPDITSACCLPVIDESKRPFQILDDATASGKSAESAQKIPKA